MPTKLAAACLSALVIAAFAFAACGDDDNASSSNTPAPSGASGGAQTYEIKITDDGCTPASIDAHTGPATFHVTNDGAGAVTEFEILDGDHIIGEIENVIAGLDRSFSMNLAPGEFTTYCPGAKTEKGKLVVTGATASGDALGADLTAAAATYHSYVLEQSDQLLAAVKTLRDKIAANDIEGSKAAYITARPFYERIEPVAESFGDLDPKIDERADEKPAEQLTGFHRIEYALWTQNTTAGLSAIADQLVADVTTLHDGAPDTPFDALQVATGAGELLSEVSQSKITGEEERYSHTDLVDFEANVEGAKAAFDAVRQALDLRDPGLATTVDRRFADVFRALNDYRTAGEFVFYTGLTPDDTRKLTQAVDALGEPLSQVAAALTQTPKP